MAELSKSLTKQTVNKCVSCKLLHKGCLEKPSECDKKTFKLDTRMIKDILKKRLGYKESDFAVRHQTKPVYAA